MLFSDMDITELDGKKKKKTTKSNTKGCSHNSFSSTQMHISESPIPARIQELTALVPPYS